MIAQGIEGVTHSSGNVLHSNETIIAADHDRISLATTLSLLAGLVQVVVLSSSIRSTVGLIFAQLLLFVLRLGFLSVYLTEPFISGFTAGSAVHVLTSQLPAIFGVQSPRGITGAFKLPRFYIRLIDVVMHKFNWLAMTIGMCSIVVLYLAKYLNERFKARIRIVLPCELVLVTKVTLPKVDEDAMCV